MVARPGGALAKSPGYTFTPITFLGDPAPGGGSFIVDFEPYGLNDSGEATFVVDLTTGGEGVFVGRKGQLAQIARGGQPAPGGGTFLFDLGRAAINGGGDIAFVFELNPFTAPFGLNGGVYRVSHNSQTLSGVEVPNVTPAPIGGTFLGAFFNTSINNRGDIVFAGHVSAADIHPGTPPGFKGAATGLFRQDKHGNIFNVVSPGDPAPGGGTFDSAINGCINDGGDIAFGGHVVGDECIDIGSPLVCGESIYLRNAATGAIVSIAHQGDPAPGGGNYTVAFGGVLNSRRDVVFIGDLTSPPGPTDQFGVFLFSKGTTIAVARPGDAMPGGGTLVTATSQDANYDLNNRGDVTFSGMLNTDVNGDGIADTGLYLFSHGSLSLVARTGTLIPGLGTIAFLGAPFFDPNHPVGTGAIINARGQILFYATLTDGRGVLLLATPVAG